MARTFRNTAIFHPVNSALRSNLSPTPALEAEGDGEIVDTKKKGEEPNTSRRAPRWKSRRVERVPPVPLLPFLFY